LVLVWTSALQGGTVALLDRDEERGRVALDEIRANRGAGEFSLVDVSVAAEMRETIRAADEVRCDWGLGFCCAPRKR
jgi:hypothetical protein